MPSTVTLLHGDTLQLLTAPDGFRSPDGKILHADACITDPPYGIDFAGERGWDSFQADRLSSPDRDFARWVTTWARPLMVDVLWPSALIAAFSGYTTVHALIFGLQDAGFDLLEVGLWLYATTMRKNKHVLKSAYEPFAICRRKSATGASATDLYKTFEKTGRGLMQVQALKAEEGKIPMNVAVMDARVIDCDDDVRDLAKFLYVPKPSTKDRDYGCDALPERAKEGGIGATESTARNFHPTVKPITVMRRMIKLFTKPGATIIDPFMGSGTTGIAAVLEGRNFIGIERESEFFHIASTRIAAAQADAAQGVAA